VNIGKMDERIIIEKNEVITDSIGNHRNVWSDYFSCYSYVSTYAADETKGAVSREQETVSFSLRYCPETAVLTSIGYRVVHRGKIYNIDAVDLMNYDHQEVRLRCSREVRP